MYVDLITGIAILVVILSVCFGSLFFIMCYLLVRRRRREALLRRQQQENEENKNDVEQQDSDHVIIILPDESIACGKIPGDEGSVTQPLDQESHESLDDSSNEGSSDRSP